MREMGLTGKWMRRRRKRRRFLFRMKRGQTSQAIDPKKHVWTHHCAVVDTTRLRSLCLHLWQGFLRFCRREDLDREDTSKLLAFERAVLLAVSC
jgi:hypothetical protein